jgi:long-chain acyl-CoA synthetase
MSLNLSTLLRERALRHPDKPAILAGDRSLSYADVLGAARRFGGALKKLGIGRGQHIALMLPNIPQFTIAYYGGHCAATPVVPLNVLLRADEVAYHLDDSDAVAMVVWEDLVDQARPGFDRVPHCKHLIVATRSPGGAVPEGCLSFDQLVADGAPITETPDTAPDDTAVILYTSGTTGRAKGAELTNFNLFYNAEVASRLNPPEADPSTAISLVVLPLFHSFGQTVLQNAGLLHGSTLVLLPRFEPTAALEAIERHKVTTFAGVPTMYFALLHHPDAARYDLSSLSHCISGGAAMPVEVMNAFDQKYRVNILEGYGLSETSPVASFNQPDRPKKPGSIGLPIWGVEFRLVADDGTEITDCDTPGELCIKGHNVMKGYYKRPEATAEAIRQGWFHSGDIGTRDADGYYYIVDRKKDMVIRGGYNVYPREIEEVLYAHPAIAEAAVIGIPDPKLGEEVKAIVALKPNSTANAEEIIGYCKERVASYKYPRIVEIVAELPKGPTGKILKRELRPKA